MKYTLQLQHEHVHRLIIHFLLEEAIDQAKLLSRSRTLLDDVLAVIARDNERQLPAELLAMASNTEWWRGVKMAIENDGLNQFDLLQALKKGGVTYGR